MDDFELYHVGVGKMDGAPGRGSGRYPLGSGANPYQRMDRGDYISTVAKLEKEGWTKKEIAEYFYGEGTSPSEFQRRLDNIKAEEKNAIRAQALDLYNQGMGYTEIGKALGKSESTIRSMLDPVKVERAQQVEIISKILGDQVSDVNYLDLGPGTEDRMGITRTKLMRSVQWLVDSGEYEVQTIYIPQAAMSNADTTMQVLVPKGTPKGEVLANIDRINPVNGYHSDDNGNTWYGIKEPTSFDSSRLMIRYAEEGGKDKDGVIELRRGIDEISLGGANYAQVRIAVDGTHYLKGMAVYADDMPPGVDIIFNTNKHVGTPALGSKDNTVLKPLKADPNNPFGAVLRTEDGEVVGQRTYTGPDGKLYLSPVNIVRQEGDWNVWSKNLASQFLSKQSPSLAKQQLNEQAKKKEAEYEEIISLTNPEIKKKLLDEFADSCDSAAVHLKAAAMPRQATKVILPITSLKDNEVYAPTFEDGEEIILVRYPHAGPFEIPRLIVNNRNPDAKSIIGNAIDAIGINSHVANRLSGADFDGDTVIAIPTKNQKLKASTEIKSAALLSLKDFDPKEYYGKSGVSPLPDGYPEVGKPRAKGGDGFNKQNQMGVITNLINDMQLKGASPDELVRAVRHSMVVIDAEKHQLNWRQSEKDNRIAELKNIYQAKADPSKPGGGASTLISAAKSEERVFKRKEITDTSKMTPEELQAWKAGKKVYRMTGEKALVQIKDPKKMTEKELARYNAGKKVYRESNKLRTVASTKMMEVDDAFKLSSGTEMESIYATFANRMKSLANDARKESRSTKNSKYDPQAAKVYEKEVISLNQKLVVARQNKPLERKAQSLTKVLVDAIKADNPDMDYDEIKKITAQTLNQSRTKVGANKRSVMINITPKEWEAIQAHAISSAKVQEILSNTNEEKFKQYATPRSTKTVSTSDAARIKAFYNSGRYTLSEIASQFGVSPTTVSDIVND